MNDQKHDHIKWFTIGFLGALAFVALTVTILVYSMTPLVKIDQSTGRVQLLGGIVDVQALDVITQLSKDGSFVIGTIEGVEKVPQEIEWIDLKFGSGQMRIDYNTTDELNWDCDGAGKNAKLGLLPDEKAVSLDFTAAFVDCDISLPLKKLRLSGMNGEIEVRKIKADLDIKLVTGDVFLDPVPDLNYEFDLHSASGKVDSRLNSDDAMKAKPKNQSSAIKITVQAQAGNVEYLD